jgi:hypothetical protein
MKVIFSRKGFDLQYGGFASPILPNGKMISIPIPYNNGIRYSQLEMEGFGNYEEFLHRIKGKIRVNKAWVNIIEFPTCHLDPDLRRNIYKAHEDDQWKPIFGQSGAAQTHLENQGVNEPGNNDIFLFFGTFREVDNDLNGFKKSSRPRHIIYGYLQIGEIIKVNSRSNFPDWMLYHPHIADKGKEPSNNTVYVARECLSFNPNLPGAGVFDYNDSLVLTKEGYSKSRWRLRKDIFKPGKVSYHKNENWKKEGYFQTNSIGQEFVVNADEKVQKWVGDLFNKL